MLKCAKVINKRTKTEDYNNSIPSFSSCFLPSSCHPPPIHQSIPITNKIFMNCKITEHQVFPSFFPSNHSTHASNTHKTKPSLILSSIIIINIPMILILMWWATARYNVDMLLLPVPLLLQVNGRSNDDDVQNPCRVMFCYSIFPINFTNKFLGKSTTKT